MSPETENMLHRAILNNNSHRQMMERQEERAEAGNNPNIGDAGLADLQFKLISLRKNIPLMYKKMMKEDFKAFTASYEKIQNENVDFPTEKLHENINQMQKIIDENASNAEMARKNKTDLDAIDERISVLRSFIEAKKQL